MLGHFEDLRARGQLERLLRSDARFAAKAMMLSAAADDAAIKIAVHRIGPALVFERLWEETGCRAVIADLAGKRGHKFSLERAVFLTKRLRPRRGSLVRGLCDRRRRGARSASPLSGDGLAGRGTAGAGQNGSNAVFAALPEVTSTVDRQKLSGRVVV
jgi:hypothetical protein